VVLGAGLGLTRAVGLGVVVVFPREVSVEVVWVEEVALQVGAVLRAVVLEAEA
jgi:hypothetical protein